MTKSGRHFHIGLAIFLLLCAASFDWLVLGIRGETAAFAGSNSSTPPTQSNSLQTSEGLSRNIRDAFEAIRPSLVTIRGASRTRFSPLLPPLLPKLSDDCRPLNDSIFAPTMLRSSDRGNGGTGVIVSEDGLIWTSSDVVRDSDSVIVTLQADKTHEGKVVLRDSGSGLAIVKIDAGKLPAAVFGKSAEPNLADWTIAVALNDRHEPILSAGLISSFSSQKDDSEAKVRMIRCGFPLSDDFTGCAFVNLRGELIGISTSRPTEFAHASSSCVALNAQSAIELQRKMRERAVTEGEEFDDPTSTADDSDAVRDLTQYRKEESLSKLETISELFSEPRSEWTTATIASSVRNWLASWSDANHSQTHSASKASESR